MLVNAWHDDNAGDSAIASVCVGLARNRWPNRQVVVHTMLARNDPRYGSWHRHLSAAFPDVEFREALFPEPSTTGRFKLVSNLRAVVSTLCRRVPLLPSRRRRLAREEVARTSALVVVGGSDLFQVRDSGLRGDLRLTRLLEHVLEAQRAGVPTFLWGHTVGPFESRRSISVIARALSQSTRVVVRERLSLQQVLDIAPDCAVVEAPDFAFALPVPARQSMGSESRTVALVPRAPFFDPSGEGRRRLEHEFAELARLLLNWLGPDGQVLLVAQVRGPGELEDDRIICRQIASAVNDRRVQVFDSDLAPTELSATYGDSLAVISMRLHGAILAMRAGTPAYAIAYFTAKTQGVYESLGLSDSWTTLDGFSAAKCMAWIGGLSAETNRAVLEISAELERQILNATQ